MWRNLWLRRPAASGIGALQVMAAACPPLSAISDSPLTSSTASSSLRRHALEVGLHESGFRRIRHYFAGDIASAISVSDSSAALGVTHGLRRDVLNRIYTGGYGLWNIAAELAPKSCEYSKLRQAGRQSLFSKRMAESVRSGATVPTSTDHIIETREVLVDEPAQRRKEAHHRVTQQLRQEVFDDQKLESY
ncbi:hypothetical protein V8E36_009890 [Tilletia maclaganii]